ncbi:phosphonate metabolism transcriptional regulator PhnF [Actibacterium ureilyticum]|uniref:phosphonate metabolism transcriptional regulator PhnF n=1 Tax=Actibacterium ureilyticum TaxID=1590614 RepID=UPI000BAAD530|nr:phosphonate metabolism transcriptional regulator PhnF [Actibacterium ureilyticum]
MARTPIWKSIATTLEGEIAAGQYRPGDKLPTEAALSQRFGVNRHTVRHALGDMGDRGLVHSRRGAGVFVAAKPTEYPIGRRVRYHQNLTAGGQTPSKQILRLETRLPDEVEAKALRLTAEDPVHVYEGLSLADDAPLAVFRSVFPAARFPGLLKRLGKGGSVTEALRAEGVTDYTRASTRLTARQADATQALHLRIREGAPILRTESMNIDPADQPLEYGLTWFAGDRICLVVTPD